MTIPRASALSHLPYSSVEGLEYLIPSIVVAEIKGTNGFLSQRQHKLCCALIQRQLLLVGKAIFMQKTKVEHDFLLKKGIWSLLNIDELAYQNMDKTYCKCIKESTHGYPCPQGIKLKNLVKTGNAPCMYQTIDTLFRYLRRNADSSSRKGIVSSIVGWIHANFYEFSLIQVMTDP